MSEKQKMQDFIAAGQCLLQIQATSAAEIQHAGQEARKLVERLSDMSLVREI